MSGMGSPSNARQRAPSRSTTFSSKYIQVANKQRAMPQTQPADIRERRASTFSAFIQKEVKRVKSFVGKDDDDEVTLEDRKELALKSIRWVQDCLDGDEQVLLLCFLEFDADLDGYLKIQDIRTMLTSFDMTATDEVISDYIKSLPAHRPEKGISFVEFMDWWRSFKNKSELLQTTLLMSRYMIGKAKEYTIDFFVSTQVEERLEEADDKALLSSIKAFNQVYLCMANRRFESKIQTAVDDEMDRKKRAVEQMQALDSDERFKLQYLFQNFATAHQYLPISKLPELARFLNVNMTVLQKRVSEEAYSDPMDWNTFLTWWICQPASGKLKFLGMI